MPAITIFPEDPTAATSRYLATCDGHESVAATIGQALDGLTAQIGVPTEMTVVVIQPMKPDRFFTAEQIARLRTLQDERRAAHDSGTPFPEAKHGELTALIDAELVGSMERTKAAFGVGRS